MNVLASLWVLDPGATALQNGAIVFFALVIGHALADFPLQGTFLAIGKERHGGLEKLTGSKWPKGVWLYLLSMHSLIHAGTVWLILGDVRYAVVELILHWTIDCAKSERLTNFYVDQGLHIACKVVYAVLLVL